MKRHLPSRRVRVTLAALALAGLALGLGARHITTAEAATETAFPIQLVTVDTPTRADKDRLTKLGLDLTEHAGHDYIEVVLHTAADEDALRAAGLDWTVRIANLDVLEAKNNRANKTYAEQTVTSPLPSGRDTYRTLDDYNQEMVALEADHPNLVKRFSLPHKSLEGKTIYGIEIGEDVKAPEDGRPVFVMLGVHHAREWPSGEHSIEFAYDLIKNYGKDRRITDLLEKSRVLVVPVVNVDGFDESRTDGALIDLRELDDGGLVSTLGTPSNAYKRKNCRIVDGQEPVGDECSLAKSPGGFGTGVDINRNYGGLWGGPGASDVFAEADYRGGGPFSEPETQNIRELVSGRQVTTLITNHTYSNLVLRPGGVNPETIGPDGSPLGNPVDDPAMQALGDRMAAQNGYTSQHAWELYDTTGSTEDWSYNATGGYGYTFEIGPREFHPPFPEVVDEYLGAGEYAGKGNREAYLIALENAVDVDHHSVIGGKAPVGATLRLKKTFATQTWSGTIQDTLDTTMTVGQNGKYTWHINPSTRPEVLERRHLVLASEPTRTQTFQGGPTTPQQHVDHEFEVTETGMAALKVNLDWPSPDDMDLEVYFKEADGSLTLVGSSGGFVGEKEEALIDAPAPGTYVLRAINYASTTPTYTLTASLYEGTEVIEPGMGIIENWTLSCEKDGKVLEQVPVVVDRGQQQKVDLKVCASKWGRR